MTSALVHRELRQAAGVALLCVCQATLVFAQQPVPPQPAAPAPAPAQSLFAPPASLAPTAFRYPAAVSGGRLLTSVFGPARPGFVRQRLTHVPDMFGDSYLHGQTLSVIQILSDPANSITATLDLPVAGGSHLLIAENNKALPTDRVYVNYNHFENALLYRVNQTTLLGTSILDERVSVDRGTFGLEKTFLDGSWSAEIRVPFVASNDFFFFPNGGVADGITAVNSSVFGNISLITKRALYADDFVVVSTGLGIELPTGDDAQARVGDFRYTVENDALHLHPYLSALADDGKDWFFNGFLQLDVPLSGNELRTSGIPGTVGTLDDQVLLHVNAGAGYWFCRTAQRTWFTGLAGLLELHFTQTLDSTDSVAFGPLSPALIGERRVELNNRRNHFTLLNLTAGIHVEITPDTLLRVAAVVPLMSEANRFFDFEPMVQLTRRF